MASRGFCRRRNASAAGGLPPWHGERAVRVARISSSLGNPRMRHLPSPSRRIASVSTTLERNCAPGAAWPNRRREEDRDDRSEKS